MTELDIDRWRSQFEEPDGTEHPTASVPPPPAGWADWGEWAVARWPSLTVLL